MVSASLAPRSSRGANQALQRGHCQHDLHRVGGDVQDVGAPGFPN